ncbi:MAG TPA: hypothetical protein DCL15_11635 [Chloroflexi bacterium]|nr:hypothetical protein [Chloroflexota bacterium]HHW84965.1 hypothetical protein [Chloroflexota bacterium]
MTTRTETTTEAWLLPGGALLAAVHEDGETCINLAVNVHGRIERPGDALVAMAQALRQAQRHIESAEGRRAWMP